MLPTLLSKRKFMEGLTKITQQYNPARYYLDIVYQTYQTVKTIMAHDFKTLVAVVDLGQLQEVEAHLVEEHGFQTLPQQASKKL